MRTIKATVKSTSYAFVAQLKDGATVSGNSIIMGTASLAACTKDVKRNVDNVRAVIITSREVESKRYEMPADVFLANASEIVADTADETDTEE